MRTSAVAITGVGLWLPGFPSAAEWTRGERDEGARTPAGRALEPMHRRRASALGRALADAAAEAAGEARVDLARAAVVVGSSVGEASTLVGLLDQMWRQETPMSPTAFTMSVHNSASGLLSISSRNRGYTTSLAADEDTPAAALLEAVGIVLYEGRAALVTCGDEAVPEKLMTDGLRWDFLAAAVVLAPLGAQGTRRARLELLDAGAATLAPAELDEGLARNPQAGLVDLVAAVLRGTPGEVVLDRGGGRGYRARLAFEEGR